MGVRRCVALIGAMLVIGCSGAKDPSGAYIVSEPDIVMMVQITGVENGKINGSLSSIAVGDDGKINGGSIPLEGTLQEGLLKATYVINGKSQLLTGMVDGDEANLTLFYHGEAEKFLFEKSKPSEFNELTEKMRETARTRIEQAAVAQSERDDIEANAKIKALAVEVNGRAAELNDATTRLKQRMAEHVAAATEITRLRGVAARLPDGHPDTATDKETIEARIGAIKAAQELTHGAIQNFAGKVAEWQEEADYAAAELAPDCERKAVPDCRAWNAAVEGFNNAYGAFARELAIEAAGFEKMGKS